MNEQNDAESKRQARIQAQIQALKNRYWKLPVLNLFNFQAAVSIIALAISVVFIVGQTGTIKSQLEIIESATAAAGSPTALPMTATIITTTSPEASATPPPTAVFAPPPKLCDLDSPDIPCLYQLQPGDYLTQIALDYLGDAWLADWLCESNNLENHWWGLTDEERQQRIASAAADDDPYGPGPCSYIEAGYIIEIAYPPGYVAE